MTLLRLVTCRGHWVLGQCWTQLVWIDSMIAYDSLGLFGTICCPKLTSSTWARVRIPSMQQLHSPVRTHTDAHPHTPMRFWTAMISR